MLPGVDAVTRREDNALLDEAQARVAMHEANARAFSIAGEFLAFAAFVMFCVLLFVALYIGPVLP